MKTLSKILATLLCLSLVLSFAVVGTFAEEATGSITIKDQAGTNATVGGKFLRVFQIFQVEKDGENTAYDWIVKGNENLYESFFYGCTIGEKTFPDRINSGKAHSINDVVAYIESLRNSAYDLSQLATDLHEYIHAKGLEVFDGYKYEKDIDEGANSYTFTDLPLGYYMIYDATVFTGEGPAVRSAAMLSHSGQDVVVELKADRPSIAKYVDDDRDGIAIDDIAATASIGETVKFRIVTKIPIHRMYGENYKFMISDVMADGLELVGTPAVSLADQPLTDEAVVRIQTTGLADGVDFEVELKDATGIDAGTELEIVYEAKVLSTVAKVNTNTVTLTYSNDPSNEESTGKVSASADVMIWDGILTKIREGSNQRLGGAEFQVFKKEGGVVSADPLTFTFRDGKYIYNPDEPATAESTTIKTGTDNTQLNFGQILIFGLGEGTYVLRETEAPTGYVQADGDFEFTLVDAINQDGSVSALNTSLTTSREENVAGQFADVRTRLYEDNGEIAMVYHFSITNRPGQALPETGGMGTAIFTVFGVVLMVGAVAFFASRKRNSAA